MAHLWPVSTEQLNMFEDWHLHVNKGDGAWLAPRLLVHTGDLVCTALSPLDELRQMRRKSVLGEGEKSLSPTGLCSHVWITCKLCYSIGLLSLCHPVQALFTLYAWPLECSSLPGSPWVVFYGRAPPLFSWGCWVWEIRQQHSEIKACVKLSHTTSS